MDINLLAVLEKGGALLVFLGGLLVKIVLIDQKANRALEMAKENKDFTVIAIKELTETLKEIYNRLSKMEVSMARIESELVVKRRSSDTKE